MITSPSAIPSGFPSTVTIRSRLSRSIEVGPRSSLSFARLASLTRPTAGDGKVIWYRSWLVERLPESARSQTSYCSSRSRNFETGKPPTSTRSVSAIVPTGTPRSLAASRSIETCTSGLRSESVVSRSTIDPVFLSFGDELVAVSGELTQLRASQTHLEGLGPGSPLERRHVVHAHPQIGIILEKLASLLLDLELVEFGTGKNRRTWPETSHQPFDLHRRRAASRGR